MAIVKLQFEESGDFTGFSSMLESFASYIWRGVYGNLKTNFLKSALMQNADIHVTLS